MTEPRRQPSSQPSSSAAYIPAQAGGGESVQPRQDKPAPETEDPDVVRVLVVDDTMEVRLLVGLLLQEEETWRVVGEAANGAEAIKRATETHPDLVLLDISMPIMDGLEALPGLRRELPDAVLVLLTAFPVSDVNDLALAGGADACLDKVNMATSLMPALRQLMLERSGRRTESANNDDR